MSRLHPLTLLAAMSAVALAACGGSTHTPTTRAAAAPTSSTTSTSRTTTAHRRPHVGHRPPTAAHTTRTAAIHAGAPTRAPLLPRHPNRAPAPGAAVATTSLQLGVDLGGGLRFTASHLVARAGRVSLAFSNDSPLGHNLTIAGPGGGIVGATPTFARGSRTLTLHLPPGTYTYYCSVPGHRQAGMQGTLRVS